MDHVINSLRHWLEVYEEEPEAEQDKNAIRCIKNALDELHKYYPRQSDWIDEDSE